MAFLFQILFAITCSDTGLTLINMCLTVNSEGIQGTEPQSRLNMTPITCLHTYTFNLADYISDI